MEQFETFSNYLNGNLTSMEEQDFFAEMNLNNELRSEFRRYIVLDRTFKQTSGLFVPPNDVTNKIYSGLGFSIPAEVAPIAALGTKSGLSTFYKFIFTGVCSALIASLFTYFTLIPSEKSINKPEKSYTSDIILKQADSNSKYNYHYAYHEKKNIERKQKTMNINSKISIPKSNNISLENIDKKNKSQIMNLSQLEIPNSKITESSYYNVDFVKNQNQPKTQPTKIISNNKDLFSYSEDLGIVFELKNSMNWNLPKETIYPNELSKFNNLSLSLLYKMNENLEIGLDLRQETFFVKYSSIDSMGTKYIFEQQPNLTSFGILTRYKTILSEKYLLMFQLGFSSNYYGLIGRAGLGLEYSIFPQMAIICNLEYSDLFYQHQNNWNSTGKIGFIYGIKYSF